MSSDLATDIGQRIVNARKKLDLSQSAFGARAGLSQNVTSSIERGAGGATLENLVALVLAHDINPVWLLLGRGPTFLREAFQPHVLQSVHKTAEIAAQDAPALIELVKDEELSAAADLEFAEIQYLAEFLKSNPSLNRFIKVEGVLNILEAYRRERVERMNLVNQLLRDRANRITKGE